MSEVAVNCVVLVAGATSYSNGDNSFACFLLCLCLFSTLLFFRRWLTALAPSASKVDGAPLPWRPRARRARERERHTHTRRDTRGGRATLSVVTRHRPPVRPSSAWAHALTFAANPVWAAGTTLVLTHSPTPTFLPEHPDARRDEHATYTIALHTRQSTVVSLARTAQHTLTHLHTRIHDT